MAVAFHFVIAVLDGQAKRGKLEKRSHRQKLVHIPTNRNKLWHLNKVRRPQNDQQENKCK